MELFVRNVDEYSRDMNIVKAYIEQNALYISKLKGLSLERSRELVINQIKPGGPLAMKFPMATVLVRGKNGDRTVERMPYTDFLQMTLERKEIMAPTMTTYMPSSVKESIPAQYIVGNLAKRSESKHAMLRARMAGDSIMEAIHNAMQTTYKYKNNALSGAHRSLHTGLYNKSAHSTLTSFCRSVTSYGNANNEKFLAGNRHYWCPDIVKANIVAIIGTVDLQTTHAAMTAFGIRPPTVDEMMECIRRSTDLYWRNPEEINNIRRLVETLSDTERAAFVYTGDLYHLHRYNPTFVEDFLYEVISRPVTPEEEPDAWMKRMDGDMKAFVSLLCSDILNGGTIDDLIKGRKDKKTGEVFPPNLHGYALVAATGRHIIQTLTHYADFIKAFWVTDVMPASVAYFGSSLRRCAITSDTDSTIFTVQYWVKTLSKVPRFKNKGRDVAYTTVYLTSQTIRHILAKLSANLGVEKKNLFLLQMKNEYFFPVFVLTSRAKHYFALIAAREGNVYRELDMEIKGVGLRNSKVPIYYNKEVVKHMRTIMDAALNGEKVSVLKLLEAIGAEERAIIKAIRAGKYEHLTKEQVKTEQAYKNPNQSNFIYHGMWEKVFAPKYGHAGDLPYRAVKVSLNLDSKTKLNRWLEDIQDPGIRYRMEEWLKEIGKTDLTMLLMPESILAMTGVPPEATIGVDVRQLVKTTMEAFYIVMESLGLYFKNDRNTRLISDHQYEESEAA